MEVKQETKNVVQDLVSTVVISNAEHQQKISDSGSVQSSYFQKFSLDPENSGVEILTDTYKLNLFIANNDASEQNLVWLVSMKEIFSKQLPKMPSEYIIRLCFDENHFTLVCVRTELSSGIKEVIGGVCFKPFVEQRFVEIAFLAVSANHQVSGFGTMIMNHLKDYIQTVDTSDKSWKSHFKTYQERHDNQKKRSSIEIDESGKSKDPALLVNSRSKFLTSEAGKMPRFTYMTHFLTYADNYAIGYFQKQGFTKEVTLPAYRYKGYIKDYDGGTLMECQLNPYINYLRIPELIKLQKEFLLKKLKEEQSRRLIYPGKRFRMKDSLPTGYEAEVDEHIISSPFDIPGVREAGWSEGQLAKMSAHNSHAALCRLKKRSPELIKLHRILIDLVGQVSAHPDAWCFQEPVPDSVLDYSEVIKEPIDLSLIKRRIENARWYKDIDEFARDIRKMCENCKLYNAKDTDYYRSAESLEKFFQELLSAQKAANT